MGHKTLTATCILQPLGSASILLILLMCVCRFWGLFYACYMQSIPCPGQQAHIKIAFMYRERCNAI